MKQRLPLILVVLLASLGSFSQTNVQAYGSYVRNLNSDYKASTYGVGLRLEFAREATSLSKYVGLAYNLPMKQTRELEAQAISNWTEPSSVVVTARYSQPLVRLELGTNLYVAGASDNFEGFNWYLNGALEAIYIRNKPTYSPYDKELYTLGWTDDSDVNPDGTDKFGLNLYLALGTGIEKTLGAGNVFLQGGLSLPVLRSGQDGSSVEAFAPIPLNVNLGYKIPLSR